ncbi:MAG: hypothetical protein ACI3U8_07330 [Candidatus Onthomonas sp.]
MTKAERSRNLRYKRPALASMGYESIIEELYDISETCDEVRYYIDGDEETLINALDGDEDEALEFKMAFADLSSKAEQLLDSVQELVCQKEYDDCTVALIGNQYNQVGYDAEEEDYYALCGYEAKLATTDAGKRLMRHTKPEIISTIGQCVGILVAFLDLRQQYDYLKATFEILRDSNTSLLRQVKEIDQAYDAAEEAGFYNWEEAVKHYNAMLAALPDRAWLE